MTDILEAVDQAFAEALRYDPTEGTIPMAKPTPTSETRARAIAGAVKLHGRGPKAVAVIRNVLGCSEAEATEYARQIHESAFPPPAGAPAAATPVEIPDQSQLAKMDTAQLRDLAAQVVGDLGFLPGTARESAPAEPTAFESELLAATGGRGMQELSAFELERLADHLVGR